MVVTIARCRTNYCRNIIDASCKFSKKYEQITAVSTLAASVLVYSFRTVNCLN